MRAVVFERYGEPSEVLDVREVPEPQPGHNQVRVRMLASPINPSDLMTVRGTYGRTAPLPATPGYEGVGVIDAVGPGFFKVARGLRPGRRVAVPNGAGGSWAETVVVPARQAVPIPADIPDEQAASCFVNPATVLAMVRDVLAVRQGDWLLQTAAASALGKMVIRLCKYQRIRTLNLVRRQDHVAELQQLGADEVIAAEAPGSGPDGVAERIRTITGGQGVPFALDAVGGAMGLSAVRSLGRRGRLLVYGALSGEPIAIDPRLIISGQKRIEGFWLSEWVPAQGVWTMLKLFREIFALMRHGILITPVQATYSLDDIRTAVRAAETPGRAGKILLKMGRD
jgi:NADPH:quinone reductase-like Zn-dependent oxidoreductase